MALVEVPDALAPALEAVLAHIDEFTSRGEAGEVVDFRSDERVLMERMAALEGCATGVMLSSLDPRSPRVRVGGKTYRRMNNPNCTASYFGLRSKFRVERGIYREEGVRNGPTIVPMELRAGVVDGQLTPAAAGGIATLGQAMPSREASETSVRLGVLPYSRSEHFRAAVRVGKRWGELRELYEEGLVEVMPLPDNVASVSVATDRASLPMREPREATERDIEKGVKNPVAVNLRMAFCGVLTLYDPDGNPLDCIRYAHVPTDGADDIRNALTDDLGVLLKRRPDLKVVALADGAVDMQNLLDAVTEGRDVVATLVDFWHLLEKLASACEAVAESSANHIPRFRAMLLDDDDAIHQIADQLGAWAQRYAPVDGPNPGQLSARPEGLHHAITYLDNNAARMRYASVHRAGLPIGSGTVEATAKTIIGSRMRRPGCRWIEPGAQPILALRALATSSVQRWQQVMEHIVASYTAHVTPLGAVGDAT